MRERATDARNRATINTAKNARVAGRDYYELAVSLDVSKCQSCALALLAQLITVDLPACSRRPRRRASIAPNPRAEL